MSTEDKPEPPSPEPPPAPPSEGFVKRYGSVAVYWFVFIGIIGLMAALNEMYPPLVEIHFAEWTAAATGWVISLLGWGGKVEGVRIINPYCFFIIIGECTAYYPVAIYLAAVLAFPCAFVRKLLGIAIGIPIVLGFNIIRLVTLCYLYRAYPGIFDAAHMLFWQALMIFFTILVWMVWVTTLAQPRGA